MTTRLALDNVLASARRALGKVAGSVGRLVMLPAPPIVPDPRTCFVPSGSPAACVAPADSDNRKSIAAQRAFAREQRALFVPTENWFAVNGYSAPFAGTVPIHHDSVHIAAAYAETLAPTLVEAFRKAGAVG